jgi:hypothetical protein
MQIPEDTQNSYGFPGKKAVHLLTATSQWDYTPMHKDTVGGALALSYDVYAKVGGYSNLFWGWGGEDNNMYTRLAKGPGVTRPNVKVGRYRALFHPRVMGLDETDQFKSNHKIMGQTGTDEGIKTVKYTLVRSRHRPACPGGDGGPATNSVVIHTVNVLNADNLHPGSNGLSVPPRPSHAKAAPAAPPATAVTVLAKSAAPSGLDAEIVFEVYQNMDCDGGDVGRHDCLVSMSEQECVRDRQQACLATAGCIGFNHPGGWMKRACAKLLSFDGSTVYLDHTVDVNVPVSPSDPHWNAFEDLSGMAAAAPVAMEVLCPLRIHQDKITVARGGEAIADAYMRSEEAEYPTYERGAFVAACAVTGAHPGRTGGSSSRVAHFPALHSAIKVDPAAVDGKGCQGPAVMMQRYEYANIYHTFQDWFSLYETMQKYDLKFGEFQVVWLDGHAWGVLDEGWRSIFTPKVTYIKQTEDCFNPVYFAADGGKSDVHTGCRRGKQKAAGFVNFVLAQLQLLTTPMEKRIIVIDRKPYVAHPRLVTPLPELASRALANTAELIRGLRKQFQGHEVLLVNLADYTLPEQIEMIRSAEGVVGMHGAALSFMLFMSPGAVLVEVSTDSPDLFKDFAACAPWVHHEVIQVGGGRRHHAKPKAYTVDVRLVGAKLAKWVGKRIS